MTVSVAVINYNYGHYLPGAIESILSQTLPVDEIVVVDDGSTDNSREVLAGYDAPVRAILTENRGPALASTRALGECTGDIVLQLDADDLMHTDRVARVVEAYAANPRGQWVFHRLTQVDRSSGETSAEQGQHRRFTDGFHDLRWAARRGWLPVTLPATSGLSWRREFLRTILPVPRNVKVHDNYLKFCSLATGPGVFIDASLGDQGMHANNFYAQKTGKDLRVTRARNSLAMLEGFSSLGRPLNGMWGRSWADAYVLSRGGRDLAEDERATLRSGVRSLPPLRRPMMAARLATATARSLR